MPHILLADEDKELSALLVEYLQTNDLKVTPVYDGKAALDNVTNNPELYPHYWTGV